MEPKVVSFASFKGGSGRSVGLANVAYQMACAGRRVGCIDFDIEGGGLHRVLKVDGNPADSLQHYLMDEEDLNIFFDGTDVPDYEVDEVLRERLVINVREVTQYEFRFAPEFKGELFLIQARPNAKATARVDTGANMFYRFNRLLSAFARVLELDYILVDCRSGISNLALPGLAYGSLTTLFFRWGSQHRWGTQSLLRWYGDWMEQAELTKDLLLVASSIDPEEVPEAAIQQFVGESRGGGEYAILPEIPKLRTRDIVLWREDDLEFQLPFRRLADLQMRMLGD